MPFLRNLGGLVAAGLFLTATARAGAVEGIELPPTLPDAARVVVVANKRVPDSEAVARYYMEKRSIPEKNLVLLDAPVAADISWSEFVEQIYNPLRSRLTAEGWIEAYTTSQVDREGRLRFVTFGHKIDFLVLCYGIPVRISNDSVRLAADPNLPARPEFATNQASVDSELALLPAVESSITALVINPLYTKLDPDSATRAGVVRVSRLDGPSASAARGLVDSALLGERLGLQGRAYLDFGGRNPKGDEWIKDAGQVIRSLGFDISENHDSALISWRERFDAPALYFGWWSWDQSGPITDDNFRFPPGAIGIHIHSFSGEAIREGNRRWVGPMVAHGIATTVGNVFEPYLEFTHNPQLFMAALARGKTVGEAAYYSLPALSWQAILIGDPLYRPFNVGLPTQLEHMEKELVPNSTYAVIRQINLLQEQGRLQDALEFGKKYFESDPTPALSFAMAQLELKLGHPEAAIQRVAWLGTAPRVARSDMGLYSEIARWAVQMKVPKLALALYVNALGSRSAPVEFKKAVLPEAIALAKQLNEIIRVREWEHELNILVPPPIPN